MRFVHIKTLARLEALVAVEGDEPLDIQSLLTSLPLSNPGMYFAAEVVPGEATAAAAEPTVDFQAGIHQFKVVFFQEFGTRNPAAPGRVETVVGSRAEAFSLMKAVERTATFSKVEVQNLQGGVEARTVLDRAGHGVVETATGKIVASRLELDDARTRFAREVVKPRSGGLQLVDFRGGDLVVLASVT